MDATWKVVEAETTKKVTQITIDLSIINCTGTINITDLMLQGGRISTQWQGHPSEVKWDNEE